MYADSHLSSLYIRNSSIHNPAYLSFGVTSAAGAELFGVPGGAILGVPRRGYAESWMRTSENSYSRTLDE
jgi:hypothetical protein